LGRERRRKFWYGKGKGDYGRKKWVLEQDDPEKMK
jgi:hypothetical protein